MHIKYTTFTRNILTQTLVTIISTTGVMQCGNPDQNLAGVAFFGVKHAIEHASARNKHKTHDSQRILDDAREYMKNTTLLHIAADSDDTDMTM